MITHKSQLAPIKIRYNRADEPPIPLILEYRNVYVCGKPDCQSGFFADGDFLVKIHSAMCLPLEGKKITSAAELIAELAALRIPAPWIQLIQTTI
jgi:hypothetical protein